MLPSRSRGCSCAWEANDLQSTGSGDCLVWRARRAEKALASSRGAEDKIEDILREFFGLEERAQ